MKNETNFSENLVTKFDQHLPPINLDLSRVPQWDYLDLPPLSNHLRGLKLSMDMFGDSWDTRLRRNMKRDYVLIVIISTC